MSLMFIYIGIYHIRNWERQMIQTDIFDFFYFSQINKKN